MQTKKKTFPCKDCGADIPGMNCAYELSYQFGWKNKKGCAPYCKCGYPIRAKEVRSNIFKNPLEADVNATDNAFIYCQEENQGHVYYGTYSHCVKGNGTTAKDMKINIFERYGDAN